MSRCARCDFQPDVETEQSWAEQLAEHSLAASHPLCICCNRSLTNDEMQTCEQCLTGARALLAGIAEMHAELPAHMGHVRAQRYDSGPRGGEEHHLPGGTVFALLAPGSAGGAPRRLTRLDVDRGLDGREHVADERADESPSVQWLLASWCQDWSETRQDGATPRSVPDLAAYLEVHARWAANQHGAFDEFVSDLRALHTRLEIATHRRRTPTRAGASCFQCGGTLERRVDSEGLEEVAVTCRVCHEQYDPARYNLALQAAYQAASRIDVEGEQWATVPALATELGRSENTIKGWRRDELVRIISYGGVAFLNVEDARREHDARPTRQRKTA